MAAAPLPPVASSPTQEAAPLSQGARIINIFIAPSKTFTDLRRSAAWWAPFLLMTVVSLIFVYTAGQKIGFRKIMENQMQAQPRRKRDSSSCRPTSGNANWKQAPKLPPEFPMPFR